MLLVVVSLVLENLSYILTVEKELDVLFELGVTKKLFVAFLVRDGQVGKMLREACERLCLLQHCSLSRLGAVVERHHAILTNKPEKGI